MTHEDLLNTDSDNPRILQFVNGMMTTIQPELILGAVLEHPALVKEGHRYSFMLKTILHRSKDPEVHRIIKEMLFRITNPVGTDPFGKLTQGT